MPFVLRKLLTLLYTNPQSQPQVESSSRRDVFLHAVLDKLSDFVDDPALIMEYAIAAFLDPRQRGMAPVKKVYAAWTH